MPFGRALRQFPGSEPPVEVTCDSTLARHKIRRQKVVTRSANTRCETFPRQLQAHRAAPRPVKRCLRYPPAPSGRLVPEPRHTEVRKRGTEAGEEPPLKAAFFMVVLMWLKLARNGSQSSETHKKRGALKPRASCAARSYRPSWCSRSPPPATADVSRLSRPIYWLHELMNPNALRRNL